MPTPNQIVLAWTVDVTNTSLGPAGAAAALGAVPLYVDPHTDPVLGQLFGLTVASDITATPSGTTASRTLTLNMTGAVGAPVAPPPFPCHPRTTTPPVLPYPLREAVTLPGSFFPSLGSTAVPTTMTQLPSLSNGDSIQFLSQPGVFYTYVAAGSTATSINISAAYTGTTKNTGAFKEVPAPVSIAAVYSSSDLDTAGAATVPAIPAGAGARTLAITYTDSAGVTGRAATASLTGRRPATIAFTNGNGVIASIENVRVVTVGGFGNSIGEITLVSLESALPAIPANATPFDFLGALTDEAQMLIDRHLAYLPPSYFALAQQGTATPQLAGDFILTTGQPYVPTTVDQTAVLSAGNVIRFAELDRDNRQLHVDVTYTIAAVGPKDITLTKPFEGVDNTNTGTNQEGTNANAGTKGNLGSELQQKRSGAFLVTPSPAAPPSNAQLAGPLAQFVAPEVTAPPPKPPLDPATVPTPVFLSDFFTQTLQLALAGVPITPATITFV